MKELSVGGFVFVVALLVCWEVNFVLQPSSEDFHCFPNDLSNIKFYPNKNMPSCCPTGKVILRIWGSKRQHFRTKNDVEVKQY